MKITSIRIKRNNRNNALLGVASVQFDDCLILHDLKLIQLKDKRIISFPNKKVEKYNVSEEGYSTTVEYTDIVHPSNKEFRQYIEDEIYKMYDLENKEEEN